MSSYVLGIDAGATKTTGLLKHLPSKQSWSVTLGSGSLSQDLEGGCNRIKEVAIGCLVNGNISASDTILVCGAAGATNALAKAHLESVLKGMNFKQFIVTSDAQTSLYGVAEGEPVIVVAIGTGSVAMRLDPLGNEKQFGGWGFTAGDQGSGASIGRGLVAAILKALDNDDFKGDELSSAVFGIIGDDPQAISNWLLMATPAKYAVLAPLVFGRFQYFPLAAAVLKKAVAAIERLIISAQGHFDLPICLTGGLAAEMQSLLSEEIQGKLMRAKGSSVDGAIFLAQRLLTPQECDNDSVSTEN